MNPQTLGRGEIATADMKTRINVLRSQGRDVIDVLWDRHRVALLGDGYSYEYAERDALFAVEEMSRVESLGS